MQAYIVRKLLWALPLLVIAGGAVFFLLNILPGDVALVILGGGEGGAVDPQKVEIIRQQLGLDRPLYKQFLSWLWGLAHLDMGKSLWTGQPVTEEIARRAPTSLGLILLATGLSTVLGVATGIICAFRQDSWLDYLLRSFAILGISVPSFWLGILILLVLLSVFRWFPPLDYAPFYREPAAAFKQLIFPALALGYRQTAIISRMMRSCMLETVREDYIRTARAKGLAETAVIWGHALKNSLLPVVTVFGIQLVLLFGATVIVEWIFHVPGIGSFLVEAISRRDFPVVQGVVMTVVAFVIVVNIAVDTIYAWLDPRIRYR